MEYNEAQETSRKQSHLLWEQIGEIIDELSEDSSSCPC